MVSYLNNESFNSKLFISFTELSKGQGTLPFYDELSKVFGKYRAEGEGVESPANAAKEITNDEENNPEEQSK